MRSPSCWRPLAECSVAFLKFGAETEGDAVGVGEVGGDLSRVVDCVICQTRTPKRTNIRSLQCRRGLGNSLGVPEHCSFTLREVGRVAAKQLIGHVLPFRGQQSPQTCRVMCKSVLATVQPADADRDDLTIQVTQWRFSVHRLDVELGVCL